MCGCQAAGIILVHHYAPQRIFPSNYGERVRTLEACFQTPGCWHDLYFFSVPWQINALRENSSAYREARRLA